MRKRLSYERKVSSEGSSDADGTCRAEEFIMLRKKPVDGAGGLGRNGGGLELEEDAPKLDDDDEMGRCTSIGVSS